MIWSYGVTTVPARVSTLLPRTLASLKAAGFDKPRLFVDGAKYSADWDDFGLEVTTRFPSIRPPTNFANWVLGLWELYLREPHADRYAMFEDDIVACVNLRQYLEACAELPKGYWNLYTVPIVAQKSKGRRGWYESNQLGKGALALVFTRGAVHTLLGSPYFVSLPSYEDRGWKNLDGAVVTAFINAGFREYVHNPSLVQHVGDESVIGNKWRDPADTFKGEQFDATKLVLQ